MDLNSITPLPPPRKNRGLLRFALCKETTTCSLVNKYIKADRRHVAASSIFCLILCILGSAPAHAQPWLEDDTNLELVETYSDEFNGSTLDKTKWILGPLWADKNVEVPELGGKLAFKDDNTGLPVETNSTFLIDKHYGKNVEVKNGLLRLTIRKEDNYPVSKKIIDNEGRPKEENFNIAYSYGEVSMRGSPGYGVYVCRILLPDYSNPNINTHIGHWFNAAVWTFGRSPHEIRGNKAYWKIGNESNFDWGEQDLCEILTDFNTGEVNKFTCNTHVMPFNPHINPDSWIPVGGDKYYEIVSTYASRFYRHVKPDPNNFSSEDIPGHVLHRKLCEPVYDKDAISQQHDRYILGNGGWHTLTLEWAPKYARYYLDNKIMFEYDSEDVQIIQDYRIGLTTDDSVSYTCRVAQELKPPLSLMFSFRATHEQVLKSVAESATGKGTEVSFYIDYLRFYRFKNGVPAAHSIPSGNIDCGITVASPGGVPILNGLKSSWKFGNTIVNTCSFILSTPSHKWFRGKSIDIGDNVQIRPGPNKSYTFQDQSGY